MAFQQWHVFLQTFFLRYFEADTGMNHMWKLDLVEKYVSESKVHKISTKINFIHATFLQGLVMMIFFLTWKPYCQAMLGFNNI